MRNFNFLNLEILESRKYQLDDSAEIIEAGQRKLNCALIYPTAGGKTPVAFMVMDHYLEKGKVLFLAHTNALVRQHLNDARDFFLLPKDQINMITGKVSQKKRLEYWENSRIVIATPQTIVSMIESEKISFREYSFVVFDEMHMANKKYAYVQIAKVCQCSDIRLLGLTASSGDLSRVENIEKNFQIRWWVYRSVDDLKKFIFPKNEKPIIIDFPDYHKKAMKYLRRRIIKLHNAFAESGLIEKLPQTDDFERRIEFYRLTELNALYPKLNKWVEEQKRKDKARPENERFLWYHYIVLFGAYYKLMHLLNLFVTENYEVTLEYIDKLASELVNLNSDPCGVPYYRLNSASKIWNNNDFQTFRYYILEFIRRGLKHPKLQRFIELITVHLKNGSKILVFSNYKSTVDVLQEELKNLGVESVWVAGGKFMKPKQQQDVLRRFRNDEFLVLLATTVVEAGIHVPRLDVAINYSMPLTGIAMIQRGGRAGRTEVGLVYYLIMNNSNDSSLYNAARANNIQMEQILRQRINLQEREQAGEDVGIMRAKQRALPFMIKETGEPLYEFMKKKRKHRGQSTQPRKKIVWPELFPKK